MRSLFSAKSVIALLLVMISGSVYVLHAQWQKVRPVDRVSAVGDTRGLSEEMRIAVGFSNDFEIKKAPQAGDWLAMHPETGQSFPQYLRAGANQPRAGKNVLYILPIGAFGVNEGPKLSELQAYTEAYYLPLRVKVLPPVALSQVNAQMRERYFGKQLHSGETLRWLEGRLPKDAYAMLAVTMTDLYPDESWNFVFGQASLKKRVGVFSFARYTEKLGSERTGKKLADAKVLARAAKVLTHEFGHMFGVKHCIYYQCNMNGANHLREVDDSPMHACPVCLRKFQHACGFSPKQRYSKLLGFARKYAWDDEANFYSKRLERFR